MCVVHCVPNAHAIGEQLFHWIIGVYGTISIQVSTQEGKYSRGTAGWDCKWSVKKSNCLKAVTPSAHTIGLLFNYRSLIPHYFLFAPNESPRLVCATTEGASLCGLLSDVRVSLALSARDSWRKSLGWRHGQRYTKLQRQLTEILGSPLLALLFYHSNSQVDAAWSEFAGARSSMPRETKTFQLDLTICKLASCQGQHL